MCLRFGSDPRRNFLSSEAPQKRPAVVAGTGRAVAMAVPGQSGQIAASRKENCSSRDPDNCGMVLE